VRNLHFLDAWSAVMDLLLPIWRAEPKTLLSPVTLDPSDRCEDANRKSAEKGN
jgi:hypothetical protein